MCGFSSSNNPLDDWNVYMLTGDALGTNPLADYPAISLTNDELFITEISCNTMSVGKKGFINL